MKIVLAALNARYIHVNSALHCLKAYARAGGYAGADDIRILEFTINEPGEEILRRIYREKPDLLAFSCYIWNIRMVLETAEALHTLLPDTKIWLGGPEVSFETEDFLKEHRWISGIMRGEGEEIFLRLLTAYESGGTLEAVPGITYREPVEQMEPGDAMERAGADHQNLCEETGSDRLKRCEEPRRQEQIRVNAPGEPVDLARLPFIYEDLEPYGRRILYYETSRGCPFSCSYCLSSVEKGIRLRPLELVLPEIQSFLDRRVPQVKMVDRTFNCRPGHARPIWTYIRDHDNGVTNFHFELEANLLQEEDLQILETMRPGLIQVEIGVQSANPVTLREVQRNPDLTRIREAARRLIASGRMHVHLDLIAGLPYEDMDSFRESFRTVYSWHPHELQLGFLKLLKGSPLRARAELYGMKSRREAPYEVLSTAWMSGEDLFALKDAEEMLEVYYNSGQFTHTIRRLEELFADPLGMYEALAAYYEQLGLAGQAQSRDGRFRILRGFIRERVPDEAERALWDQLLLRDLYLRENAKSRPDWAPAETETWRLQRRAFYEAEERKRRYLPDHEGVRGAVLARMTHLEQVISKGSVTGYELFDYRNRDPVTGNVRCCRINAEEFSEFVNN